MRGSHFPLGCYGKLPFDREYIKIRHTPPTSQALIDWLHRGREEAGLSDSLDPSGTIPPEKKDVELSQQLRVLIGLPGSVEILAAVVRPSHGRGDRSFPFAVFTHIPRRLYGRHYALLPVALAQLWEELGAAWDSLASVASKAAFDEISPSIEIPAPAPVRLTRDMYKLRQEQPATGPFEREDGASLSALESHLPEVLSRLGQRGSDSLRLELPVSRDLEQACFDVSVWIDLISRQFFLKRFEPCVFLEETRANPNRSILLKFGALDAGDYAAVTRLQAEDVEVLRPANAPGATEPEPSRTYAELLGKRFSLSA